MDESRFVVHVIGGIPNVGRWLSEGHGDASGLSPCKNQVVMEYSWWKMGCERPYLLGFQSSAALAVLVKMAQLGISGAGYNKDVGTARCGGPG